MSEDIYDRRIADWLEEGVQTVPDWLVDSALEEAHALPQAPRSWRRRWQVRGGGLAALAPRLAPLLAGAVGALAIVLAFSLGLLANRQPADQPGPSSTASPSPSSGLGAPSPRLVPLTGIEPISVLPPGTDAFYTLLGLAATDDAVWTVAVVEGDGGPVSILARLEATTGASSTVALPAAVGMLAPPVFDGEAVWTASGAGLHRVDDANLSITTVPLEVVPRELSVGEEGLWVAHDGGATLIDPGTGEEVRRISSSNGRRLVGAPAFGSIWTCANGGTLARIDPTTGQTTVLTSLPPERAADCVGPVGALSGVGGLPDSVLAGSSNVLVDPFRASVSGVLDLPTRWHGLIVVDGQLWFLVPVPGSSARLGLTVIDPATQATNETLTFEGRLHLNATFESDVLAATDEHLWLLADAGAADPQAQVLRVPLGELRTNSD